MESRKDNPKHPDESCQKEKNGRNFRRTIRKSTSLGERLARGGDKKYRVILTNLKNSKGKSKVNGSARTLVN